MTKSSLFRISPFFLFVFGVINPLFAQLKVAGTGEVGIGADASSDYRTFIQNNNTAPVFSGALCTYAVKPAGNSADISGIENYVQHFGSGFSIGIYNDVNPASSGQTGVGAGFRWGQRNRTFQPAGVNSETMGIRNELYLQGTGSSYGLYNTISSSVATGAAQYGLYSYLNTANAGNAYGLYSYMQGGDGDNYTGFFYGGKMYVENSNPNKSSLDVIGSASIWGTLFVNGNTVTGSDIALKDNVADVTNALERLKKIKSRTYTLKSDKKDKKDVEYGFVAQELETTLPEFVRNVEIPAEITTTTQKRERTIGAAIKDKDGKVIVPAKVVEDVTPVTTVTKPAQKVKSVNYMGMIALLVRGMQEQQAIIDDLKARIEKLEKK
jgi:Chaperone of endosialidase